MWYNSLLNVLFSPESKFVSETYLQRGKSINLKIIQQTWEYDVSLNYLGGQASVWLIETYEKTQVKRFDPDDLRASTQLHPARNVLNLKLIPLHTMSQFSINMPRF